MGNIHLLVTWQKETSGSFLCKVLASLSKPSRHNQDDSVYYLKGDDIKAFFGEKKNLGTNEYPFGMGTAVSLSHTPMHIVPSAFVPFVVFNYRGSEILSKVAY